MKKCPQCGTTYTDQSLRFCLADGAVLDNGGEPAVVSGRNEPLRVDIGSGNRPGVQVTEPARKSSPAIVKTILVLSVLVALAVVVIAAAVGILYLQSQENIFVNSNSETNISTPTPSATLDPETERLKKELADLQKQLDEKKSTSVNKDTFPDLDDLDLEFRTATVNSPGDGFLALRSEPSSDYGERLAQIPHGAKINVVSCDSDKITIGSRRGSWCLVEWSGRAGWVFDAWLTYEKN
jgi:hypothetical protein